MLFVTRIWNFTCCAAHQASCKFIFQYMFVFACPSIYLFKCLSFCPSSFHLFYTHMYVSLSGFLSFILAVFIFPNTLLQVIYICRIVDAYLTNFLTHTFNDIIKFPLNIFAFFHTCSCAQYLVFDFSAPSEPSKLNYAIFKWKVVWLWSKNNLPRSHVSSVNNLRK